MNRKNLRNLELRLGLTQIVLLLGVILGGLACSFGLGFLSGRSVGIDMALNKSSSDMARLPIPEDQLDNTASGDQAVAEVYAKLNQTGEFGDNEKSVTKGKAAANELAPIKSSDEAPVINPEDDKPIAQAASDEAQDDSTQALKDELIDNESHANEQQAAVVRTLGDSLPERSHSEPVALAHGDKVAAESAPRDLEQKKIEQNQNSGHEIQKEVVREKPVETVVAKKVEEPKVLVKAVPVTPAVKEVTTTKIAASDAIPHGWYAQVAAPRELKDAEGLSKKLRTDGFAVVIENAKVRGDDYFRVLVGPEDAKTRAERLVEQLKRERYISSDPFIKMVK